MRNSEARKASGDYLIQVFFDVFRREKGRHRICLYYRFNTEFENTE